MSLCRRHNMDVSETKMVRDADQFSVNALNHAQRNGVPDTSLGGECLQSHTSRSTHDRLSVRKRFRFVDLFAGIGGMRIPFEELGGHCVFTSEWDKFAQTTYGANFHESAEHVYGGDIRLYSEAPEVVPKHDVLLGGFPCQPFSIAGVSKKNSLGVPHGLDCNSQGTLFFEIAKIIEYHRPAIILLENVKNLERHQGGRTLETILDVLENRLGYEIHKRVICSAPWVPQKRERIFFVGFSSSSDFNFDELLVPEDEPPVLGDILDSHVPSKYTLTENLWSYLKAYKEKHRKAGNGFGFSLFGPSDVARTLSARYYKDGSEILIRQEGDRPRRLTPRECARLMGFDAPKESQFRIVVSDTHAYQQFGNAVVVPVVRSVAQLIAPYLDRAA